MSIMNPQQQIQQLQECIQDCKGVVKELQNITQKAKQTELKSTLKESAHHLEMCIHECDFATKAAD